MNKLINNIINAISNGLSKLIGAVKRFGIGYSLTGMLILVLSYTLIINPIRID